MPKNLDFALLLEIYGRMLTDKQRDVMEFYYWDDLSLGEISQNAGITRQAVRDSVKRSEQLLEDFENKLGLAEKIIKCRANCSLISRYAQLIKHEKQFNIENIEKIHELASETGDLF